MKKSLSILLILLLGACAKEPPFDAIAVFKLAEERMRNEEFEKARKGYQEIQEKSPDKSYDAVLMLRIADTYFGEEKFAEALVEYQAFLNYHPVNRDAAYAQYQVGMCNYNELSTIDRDPTSAHTVIREMRRLLEKYPRSGFEEHARKYISLCTDWVSEYELYVARFYHKKDSFKAAAVRLEKLLADYPGAAAEKEALLYAGMTYQELGEHDKARAKYEMLAQKYPAMRDTARSRLKKLDQP